MKNSKDWMYMYSISIELFKSMIYKDGKVFTRQCSNNVYPKHFYSKENIELTKRYNELGQVGFEKWFITNCLMHGTIEVLSDSNKILRRLNYLFNLLRRDKGFKKLKDNETIAFGKMLLAKTEEEREIASNKYKLIKEDKEKYISSFYDINNPKYREIERER